VHCTFRVGPRGGDRLARNRKGEALILVWEMNKTFINLIIGSWESVKTLDDEGTLHAPGHTVTRTGMSSLDVPRVPYVVAFLLFATGIGHVLVSGGHLIWSQVTIEAEQTFPPPASTRSTILFHDHLAKTAGSTFNRIVARRYYGVCGHKGYTFAQKYEDETHPNTDSAHPGYGLDRVHPARMSKWGWHNCALITHETSWQHLGNIANDTVWYMDGPNISSARIPQTKLLVPCRDPVDHMLSQCNHRRLNFTNLTIKFGNCSSVIDRCKVQWNRYDHRLISYFDKVVLFEYDDFNSVIQYLDESLPKRVFDLDDSANGFFRTNKDRSRENEIFTPQCPEEELRQTLLQAWSYYRLCDAFLGATAWNEYDASTLASNIKEKDL